MRSALGRLALWLGIAGAAAAAAPSVAAADPTLYPLGEALTLGGATGALLFVVLARRPPPAALPRQKRRRLAARGVVVTVRSAQEEALWRGLVLGCLADPLGRAAAVVVSTLLFAGAHLAAQGRLAAVHLVTGGAFALVYVVSGRLTAAIAAHGTYNVLVGAASLADDGMSVSDTGRPRATLLRSGAPPPRRPSPMHGRTPTPRSDAVASLEGVVKSYGSVAALAGVDLELRRGEVLALLGANGAGKSTAVAVMLGLRRADAGRATLFGLSPRDPAARRRVGAVLQDVGFPPGLRVRDTVDLVRPHYADAATREEALGRVGLSSLADRYAGGLSGGERRRLAVALALLGRPAALFLDEPTAGMDASARRRLLAGLRELAMGGGSVLLTTQQLAEAEEIATRVVLLARGRVILDASVSEVRARAGRARVTLCAASLPDLPGATSVESQGDRHVLHVDDADSFVAELVRSGTAFSDLAVVPVSLEDAFVALTAEAEQ